MRKALSCLSQLRLSLQSPAVGVAQFRNSASKFSISLVNFTSSASGQLSNPRVQPEQPQSVQGSNYLSLRSMAAGLRSKHGSVHLLDHILQFQNGVPHCVSYATALREIRAGKKTSHWLSASEVQIANKKISSRIWWIWPSLLKSVLFFHLLNRLTGFYIVRKTSRPDMQLPDFATARIYLEHETLTNRLVEITRVDPQSMSLHLY